MSASAALVDPGGAGWQRRSRVSPKDQNNPHIIIIIIIIIVIIRYACKKKGDYFSLNVGPPLFSEPLVKKMI